MLTLGHLIIRVHLDTQVTTCVDELHQQGQLTVIVLVDSLSEDILRGFIDNRYQVTSSILAIGYNAGTGWYGTNLPTLTNRRIRARQFLIMTETVASPHYLVQVRLKEKWIQFQFLTLNS
jgi:hypothetical protein